MPIPNIPPALPMPIANSGDVNDIPVTTPTGTGQLSFQAGFPFITQVPLLAGGIAPSRPDFNAALKLLSQHTFFAQSGGVYPWQGADDDFAGLNYLVGWHVMGANGHEYIAKLPSGPDVPATGGGFVGPKDPTADDGTYWLDMMNDNDLSQYGTYTTRDFITVSGTWTAPVTGWYRVIAIGGGGGGGKGGRGISNSGQGGGGGLQGGTTTFGSLTAAGGSGGGGGSGYLGHGAGGGGGGKGYVEERFMHLTQGVVVNCNIGSGGAGATASMPTGTYVGQNGTGPKFGYGGNSMVNAGMGGGEGGGHGDSAPLNYQGSGGNGAVGTSGYGGGGGGGGGCDYSSAVADNPGYGGRGNDDGQDGITGQVNIPGNGGNGGSGAVIIEYQGAV